MTTKKTVDRLPAPVLDWTEHPNLGFGKYAKWPLYMLPLNYCLWLLSRPFFKNRAEYAAVRALAVELLQCEAQPTRTARLKAVVYDALTSAAS